MAIPEKYDKITNFKKNKIQILQFWTLTQNHFWRPHAAEGSTSMNF